MFEMKNEFGNIYRTAENIKERDRLISLGYFVISGSTDEKITEKINTTAAEFEIEDLSKKTIGELKNICTGLKIEFSNSDKKADIIEKIKGSGVLFK